MSREAVNRRLGELVDRGLVEKIERSRYEIAQPGEQYLDGDLAVEGLEKSG